MVLETVSDFGDISHCKTPLERSLAIMSFIPIPTPSMLPQWATPKGYPKATPPCWPPLCVYPNVTTPRLLVATP